MDLFGGYLLILLVLFSANTALLLANFKLDNKKAILISAVFFAVLFVLMNISGSFTNTFSFLQDYGAYLFFIIFLILVLSLFSYVMKGNLKLSIYCVTSLFLISIVLLSSQTELGMFDTLVYSLLVFIIFFVVYQLSKLLHHAKRQYSVIIGEYMCLLSILVFILSLTYNSTRTLDYTAFSAFLILTPTYQLIYVIIAIIVVLVIGVLINDNKGGNS